MVRIFADMKVQKNATKSRKHKKEHPDLKKPKIKTVSVHFLSNWPVHCYSCGCN